MSEILPPVERGNALELSEYNAQFLPEIGTGLSLTGKKLPSVFEISLEKSSSISPSDLDSCFELLSGTSQQDYASAGMGWHPTRKRKEMKLPDLRYLLVKRSAQEPPKGFASFMLTYEDGKEVVYLYEIHLLQELRGTGLGKRLMGLVEIAGRNAGMVKSMLTVFRRNESARAFYLALGYAVDDYSPAPRVLRGGVIKESDYDILSKPLSNTTSRDN